MKNTVRAALAVLMLATIPPTTSFAAEGGTGAYLLGSRAGFAGIVPGPGFYMGIDYVYLDSAIEGLSLAGVPIQAKADLSVAFAKLSLTNVFDTEFLGGTPAFNVNIPYIFDAELSFLGINAPVTGLQIKDTTSGVGDITLTSLVGWHAGNLHYSAAFSVYVPTGSYATASIDVPGRTLNALNTGKNIWSFQPVLAATHFDPTTGLEFSGAASLLFSTRNKATDYQNAPALNLEGTILQHTKNGWAFGVSGYAYNQLGDDSGSGAATTRAALGAASLSAQVYGLGPMVSFSGAKIFGKDVSFLFKYYNEFGAKRRFESDVFWLNMSMKF